MKVGILTVYSFNYGSYFQATSLYKQLESMGIEVEFINEKFKRNKWGNLFLLYMFDDLVPGFLKGSIAKVLPQYRTYLQLKKDVKKFSESDKRILDMKRISKKYDCVILGADEMWSASMQSIRYTPEHFGKDIVCPHFSYATSGVLFDTKNSELVAKAKKDINSYYDFGVRDTYTKGVVKLLTGKEATQVLDPTLLNPYFIKNHGSKKETKEEYILLYGSEYSEAQQTYIKGVAKEHGYKIYSLGWPQEFSDKFLDPASADEFISCFAGASVCFPSTFHGTIFSILNHKPFLSMTNELRGRKVTMLLKDLELSYRIYEEGKTDYKEIDYNQVEELLAKKRKESLAYLTGALKKIEEDYICPKSSCSGCTACLNACPFGAIKMEYDGEGFKHPVIDKDKCKNCGLCKKVCPANKSMDVICKDKTHDQIYAAFSRKNEDRVRSSSGGAFYAIAKKFIEDGGLVYGAAFDEKFKVRHIRVENAKELAKLRSSKYVQSDLGDSFAKVKADLETGKKVLFSGTPCQIAGLNAYITSATARRSDVSTTEQGDASASSAGTENDLLVNKVNKMLSDNLLTVDILCHGVPSPKVFADYLKAMAAKRGAKIKSVNFRNKSYGWNKQAMAISFDNGEKYIKRTESDPYYIMYFGSYMLRQSCNECKYASYKRCSDITLGDYWGVEKLKHKDLASTKKGVSLVIVGTEKGEKLFKSVVELKKIQGDKKSSYQPIFERGTKASPRRQEFFKDYADHGYGYVAKKYGKLTPKQVVIKKIIAPVTRKLGIFDLAQKIFFVYKK